MQAGAAAVAAVSIYLSSIPYIGFLFAATASYGYAVGIPILVAVPLTVAIASILAGPWPIWFSTIVIAALMVIYYSTIPAASSAGDLATR